MIERAPEDLYEALFQIRDEQRERNSGRQVVRKTDLVQQLSRQGLISWYMHPSMKENVLNTFLFYQQEIPPGSRSGRQRHQGAIAHLFIQGRGYTMVNGVRHDWQAVGSLLLPLLEEGVIFQHFNADTENPVKMLVAIPNYGDALGYDMGTGFEQLEDCPEYTDKYGKAG